MNDRVEGARGLTGSSFGSHSNAILGNITHNTTNYHSHSPHPPASVSPKPCVMLGLLPQRANIIDRPGLREELWRLLSDDFERESVALWGLPGSGKTQLALQYAYRRFQSQDCSVFWVDARTEGSFLASVRDIAENAGINTLQDDDSVLLTSVRNWIQRQPSWVLVLDGVDDVGFFAQDYVVTQDYRGHIQPREFLPQGYNGTIIWTSQDRRVLEIGGPIRGLRVDSMALPEAVSLLQNAANRGDSYRDTVAAESLVQELQLSPLAISHAASWMRERSFTPEEMLAKLKAGPERAEILTCPQANPDRPQDTLRSILDVLITPTFRLDHHTVSAYNIITTLAFMSHLAIPRKIVHASQGDGDQQSARKAVDLLKDLSLLRDSRTTGAMEPSYDMPVLVQEAIRHHLSGVCLNRRLNALKVVGNEFPREMRYEHMALCGSLLEHALKVIQWPSQDYDRNAVMAVADLSSRVGNYLYFCGRWPGMEIPYRRALEVQREHLGAHHPCTAAAMDNLGWAYLRLGKLDAALVLFVDAREIRVERLNMATKDPEVLSSDMNMGVAYREQDLLGQAEELLKRALKRRNRVLGSTHNDTVQSKIELAELYGRGSKSYKAVKMLRDALKKQSVSFGEHDPRTMQTNSFLGFCQAIHDDYAADSEARKILEDVLGQQQKRLGMRHPHSLETQTLLGYVLFKQDHWDDAVSVLVEAATGYVELLDIVHPKTKDALLMLADVYFAQRDLKSAADIQRTILDYNRRCLGPLHRDTLLAQMDFAQTYFSMGHLSESKELGRAAYDSLLRKYGSNDRDSVKAAGQLAEILGVEEEQE